LTEFFDQTSKGITTAGNNRAWLDYLRSLNNVAKGLPQLTDEQKVELAPLDKPQQDALQKQWAKTRKDEESKSSKEDKVARKEVFEKRKAEDSHLLELLLKQLQVMICYLDQMGTDWNRLPVRALHSRPAILCSHCMYSLGEHRLHCPVCTAVKQHEPLQHVLFCHHSISC
jgi:hypothetical protein